MSSDLFLITIVDVSVFVGATLIFSLVPCPPPAVIFSGVGKVAWCLKSKTLTLVTSRCVTLHLSMMAIAPPLQSCSMCMAMATDCFLCNRFLKPSVWPTLGSSEKGRVFLGSVVVVDHSQD